MVILKEDCVSFFCFDFPPYLFLFKENFVNGFLFEYHPCIFICGAHENLTLRRSV